MVVIRLFLLAAAFLISPALSSAAPININSDFSLGLTGWSTGGTVTPAAGTVLLPDFQGGGTLFQSTNTGPGTFILTFDLLSQISSKGDPGFNQGVFADIAAGTLYFSSTALNLGTLTGNSFTPLFDADSNGVTTSLQSSVLGGGWFRYSLTFTTAFNYVTPVFDMFDQDFVLNSFLAIDNVEIAAVGANVPEPATIFLLVGALPFIRRRLN